MHYLCSRMAGIYFHIPFCKSRCRYCDFFSTTMEELHAPFVGAACMELSQRHDYLKGEDIETLYFGGGTPSRLPLPLLRTFFEEVKKNFGQRKNFFEEGKNRREESRAENAAGNSCEGQLRLAECTVEANPDDVGPDWAKNLLSAWSDVMGDTTPLRISLGIQSFDDGLLTLIGRRHSARQAIRAVETLRETGISEISIDLMYGLPGETEATWQHDLLQAVALEVPHISAYHLSYEKGTAMWKMRNEGTVQEIDEESSLLQFRMLREALLAAGYEHYEISNFALPGHHAKHNSNYWDNVPYLGIGPGAHSYDGVSRRCNNADLKKYLKTNDYVKESSGCFTVERLSPAEQYDEYIMTHLRTAKGISPNEVRNRFGKERSDYLLKHAQRHLDSNRLKRTENGRITLTEEGIFVSDGIIADLFADD